MARNQGTRSQGTGIGNRTLNYDIDREESKEHENPEEQVFSKRLELHLDHIQYFRAAQSPDRDAANN